MMLRIVVIKRERERERGTIKRCAKFCMEACIVTVLHIINCVVFKYLSSPFQYRKAQRLRQ